MDDRLLEDYLQELRWLRTASGEFARLAEALLRPLFTATFVESSRPRKAAAPAGDQA